MAIAEDPLSEGSAPARPLRAFAQGKSKSVLIFKLRIGTQYLQELQ